MNGTAEHSSTTAPPSTAWLGRAGSLQLQRRCACGGGAGLSGDCESCAKEALSRGRPQLQRRSASVDALPTGVPASVRQTLARPGLPLDGGTRRFMEGRFAQDFSGVRVHSGPQAAASARDVHALAYTVGQDVVFAGGQYQPHSDRGRHLIAHELAHTVQQRGLQRSGTPALADQGPEYRRLEAEADRAADAAMRGAPVRSLAAAAVPVLSRTAAPAPASQPVTVESGPLGNLNFQVTPDGDHGDPSGSGPARQRRFLVEPFYLPGTKGARAQELYQQRAQRGQLQATVQIVGTTARRTAHWQQRDPPPALGDAWVRAVRWPATDRDANWAALAGGAAFPQTSVPGASTCNMDHIVELQLQGGNDPENLQALDAAPNQSAGGAIWSEVSGLGTAVAAAFSVGNGDQVQLVFTRSQQLSPVEPHVSPATGARSCLMIDHAARAGVETRPVRDAQDNAARSVTLVYGAIRNDFVVPADWGQANRSAPLWDEAINRASAQMLSGFQLRTLDWRTARNANVVARIDERAGRRGSRLPLTLAGSRGQDITITATRGAESTSTVYTMAHMRSLRTDIAFNYEFLSPGAIKELRFTEAGELDWRGEINTSVPFLPRPLLIKYEGDNLMLQVDLTRNTLRSPIPGFTLTEANLQLGLSPLAASGNLGFALGRPNAPLATGRVEVVVDGNGLSASGRIDAHIPGVDTASGTVNYRNGTTTGQIVIESTQIRLPNVQRGRIQVDIDGEGIHPSGELELLLPRNLGNATLGVAYESGRFVYSGRGRLQVPGLQEVDIRARFDGVSLHAEANNIGFRWQGLDGRINVAYDARGDSPGVISGSGNLTLRRGDVTGSVDVTLHNSGRFSGRGRLTYPFTIQGQRIEASAGVIVSEDQSVRVEGALRFPQPIELFRRFGDNRRLFHFQRSIPIPGLSIGPVGVVAVIEGGVSARYGFGPGQLRNVSLEAAFNPLAEHIDPNVAFHAELHIPAEAGIAGTIGGGLGVEAGLGRVDGTLTVTADLGLIATLGGPLDLRYENRQFAVNARPGIDASLNLGLSLDAHARAEAGIGSFSVGTEKSWNLGRRAVVLGRFSMHAPIGWSSAGGFSPPTMDQIEWGPLPEIDPGDLLAQLFRSSSTQEQST